MPHPSSIPFLLLFLTLPQASFAQLLPTSRPQDRVIERRTLEAPPEDASDPASAEQRAARALVSRVDAPASGPMLITIPAALWEQGTPIIRADSGKELAATHLLVRVHDAPTPSTQSRASFASLSREQLLVQWLGSPIDFEVQPVPTGATRATLQPFFDDGFGTIALVQQPAKREGTTLVVGSQRASVRWLPPLAPTSLVQQIAIRQPQPPIDPPLLAHLQSDVTQHWRLWLLTGEVPAAPIDTSLASQLRSAVSARGLARASSALLAIQSVKPDLASNLHTRLTRRLKIASELVMPAWTTDQAQLEQLWDDANQPQLSPARRCDLVARWLRDQPSGAAWVQDDASPLLQSASASNRSDLRQPLAARLQLANLDTVDLVSWLRVGEGPSSPSMQTPEMQTVAPGATIPLVIPHTSANDESAAASSLRVGLGTWSFESSLLLRDAPASPPLLALGMLRQDLSLQRWLSPTTDPLTDAPSFATAITLSRISHAGGSAWVLTAECEAPATLTADVLRVELGTLRQRIDVRPTDASRVGEVEIVTNFTDEPSSQHNLPPRTWRAWIFIPQSTIDAGRLMLGVSRETSNVINQSDRITGDAANSTIQTERASWPRAIVPWQAELPRARIDLEAWDPLAK